MSQLPSIRPRSLTSDAAGLVAALAVCWAAAAVGSLLTIPNIPTWYAGLVKPTWTPPNAVFGPVWTVLYTLMAISAWLVWRTRDERAPAALVIFGVHLLVNVAWSGVFFGLHAPGLAFLNVVLLWLFIVATVVLFLRIHRLAGLLLLPYLAWVSYASALNFAIWRLNP